MAEESALEAELDVKEKVVLGCLKRLGRPISEDRFHERVQLDDMGKFNFDYEFKDWADINPAFREAGVSLYSPMVHKIVDGLVQKGYVSRESNKSSEIRYVRG